MKGERKARAESERKRLERKMLLIAPDVNPPEGSGKLSKGYWYNSYNMEVGRGCSSHGSHSTWSDDKTTIQGARALYSTKRLALLALRSEVELQNMERIERINAAIIANMEEFK